MLTRQSFRKPCDFKIIPVTRNDTLWGFRGFFKYMSSQ